MKKARIYCDRYKGQDFKLLYFDTKKSEPHGQTVVMFTLDVPEDHELWPPEVSGRVVLQGEIVEETPNDV